MRTKNTLIVWCLLSLSWIFSSFADSNKDTLLTEIDALKTHLETLQSTKSKDLETQVQFLVDTYNKSSESSGYDAQSVNYLVSMGKLSTNFSQDLKNEFTSLRTEIQTLTQVELTALTKMRDDVNFQASITDVKKASYETDINKINENYKNLTTSFATKITALQTKHTQALEAYKGTLKSAVESNSGALSTVKTFAGKYDELFKLYTDFDKNYSSFKNTYLAYASDLSLFNETKQKEYVQMLRTDLETLRDKNLEANPAFKNYKGDIDRLIEILLENFKNSLSLKMQDSYGVLFSDTDVESLVSRYNTVKNRYYDTEGNLKAQEVLSASGSLEEVAFINQKLGEINAKVKNLIGEGDNTNNINNLKIRLENEIVYFYNDNYEQYRSDLIQKLKEKLSLAQLETKNSMLAIDTIDLKYSLLNDKITKWTNIASIKSQIKDFNKDLEKYSYMNSASINKKIFTLHTSLSSLVTKKELAQSKYKKYSWSSYAKALVPILEKIKAKFPDTYQDKLLKIVDKIDSALESDLPTKKSFMLLTVKSEILNFIK